ANLESLGRDILEVLRNLTIAKLPGADGANSPLADLPDHEAAELRRLAERASVRDLMRLFKLMADAQEQLIRSPYPDLLLEMAVIRMATLAPVLDADELMRAIGAAGSGSGGAGGGARGVASASSSASSISGASAGPAQSSPTGPQAHHQSAAAGARRIPLAGEVKADAPRRAVPSQMPEPPRNPMPASPPSSGGELPDLREFIRGKRAALFGFMEQGASLRMSGDTITVVPRSDIYVRYLHDNRNVIAELASELYGHRIKVEIGRDGDDAPAAASDTISEPAPPAPSPPANTPAAPREAIDSAASEPSSKLAVVPDPPVQSPAVNGSQSQAEMRQAVYGDPVVRRIFDEFEARLVEVRAQPPASGDPAGGKK
ncbi:MAG TPA: hypothetical protein VJ718_04580, partial [Candidatus Binataceae bacterium]|nr:hypothetical protein [Candidatus Binataceae bacterium]